MCFRPKMLRKIKFPKILNPPNIFHQTRSIASESKNPNAATSLIFSNFYKLFNVPYDASPDELKAAYLIKAKEFHPDKNPDDREKATANFMKIREAYLVMSDDSKRKEYDKQLIKKGSMLGRDQLRARAQEKFRSSKNYDFKTKKFSGQKQHENSSNQKNYDFREYGDEDEAEYEPNFYEKREIHREQVKQAVNEWETMFKESFINAENEFSKRTKNQRYDKPGPNQNQYQRPDFINVNMTDAEAYKEWHRWMDQHTTSARRSSSRSKFATDQQEANENPFKSNLRDAYNLQKDAEHQSNSNAGPYFGPADCYGSVLENRLHQEEYKTPLRTKKGEIFKDHMENYKARVDPNFQNYHRTLDEIKDERWRKRYRMKSRLEMGLDQEERDSLYNPGHRPFNKSKEGFSGLRVKNIETIFIYLFIFFLIYD